MKENKSDWNINQQEMRGRSAEESGWEVGNDSA